MHSKQNITSSYMTGNKPTDSCSGGGRGGVGWRLQVLREYSTTDSYIWKLSTISSHKRDKQHFMTQEKKKKSYRLMQGKTGILRETTRAKTSTCEELPDVASSTLVLLSQETHPVLPWSWCGNE